MAENKITKQQAVEMQNMSLAEKYAQTYSNILDWYLRWNTYNNNAGAYVSFSGGKDSTVLAYITAEVLSKSLGGKIPLVLLFCDTGLEYPEIKQFVKKYTYYLKNKFANLEIILEIARPKKSFKQVITDYGYPIISKEVAQTIYEARKGQQHAISKLNGERNWFNQTQWKFLLDAPFKISHKCCDVMKKSPAHRFSHSNNLMCITAEMAAESQLRMQKWLQHSCNGYDIKEPKSMAMAFWNEQDILKFILDNNIPIASVYGEIIGQIGLQDCNCNYECSGCQRTGCIFCGFGAHRDKGENRYQRLKQTHPKLWEYCIGGGEYINGLWQPNSKGLGFAVPLEYVGIKYE